MIAKMKDYQGYNIAGTIYQDEIENFTTKAQKAHKGR
jgi:hypothetical protein